MAKTSGLASISEGRSDIHRIDPRRLKVKANWNSRDFADPSNIEHVEGLARSIAEVGVKEPLTVVWHEGEPWIIDGECRYRATMHAMDVLKAEIRTVPVKTEERYASEGEMLFSQQLRNSGKPFTVLEQAKLFKRLLDLGWQQGDIAKRAGMSAARVSQILDFNAMPEAIKVMVLAGTVAPTTAMATVKASENGTQAEQALKQGLQQAQAEGKTKVTATHVAKANGGEPKVNAKSACKNAFEYADVDDSDEMVVVIKMPFEQWEVIRKVLEL